MINSDNSAFHRSGDISHTRSAIAYFVFVVGSFALYVICVAAALCLISFFMMFSGRALTFYWMWSFSLALPFWIGVSYWLFRRVLRALPVTEGANVGDPLEDETPRPRPWINSSAG